MAMGTCWQVGTWTDSSWVTGSWADRTPIAPTLDLTTYFVPYVQDLRDVPGGSDDSTTLVHQDEPTVIAGTTQRRDKNTQYWEYLEP